MSGAGLRAMVLPRPLPTPVLAFAIRHLGAAAGVMVTASHNPPQDNGYKVYLGDGSQIVPPADAEIAAAIAAVGPLAAIPRGDDWVTLDDDVLDDYLDRVASLPRPVLAARPARRLHPAARGRDATSCSRRSRGPGFPDAGRRRPPGRPGSRLPAPWRSPTRRSPARSTSRCRPPPSTPTPTW